MSRDTNFYYSFLGLSVAKRRAIVAVWDFCRAVDDTVDLPGPGDKPRNVNVLTNELERWRDDLRACFKGDEPQADETRRLKPHIHHFRLSQKPFDDLIDGIGMDIGGRRYETFSDLYKYCFRVASTVGLICIEIFGYRNQATRDYAITLGVALQLTNIIRDVPTDLSRGRIYLPLDDLRRFGCSDDDLRTGASQRVRALLEFECQRARSFYSKAHALLPNEDAKNLIAAEIMGAIYLEILDRIERRNYDVFSEVVRVPRLRRALIATSVWRRTMFRRSVCSTADNV